MRHDLVIALLTRHGIQPSAQRVAVADYVLYTDEHPSADRVFAKVRKSLPVLSRATVYNTLNLLVKKGLLREGREPRRLRRRGVPGRASR
jgi:Fe2+ or Zn2+ uptake regulation protein